MDQAQVPAYGISKQQTAFGHAGQDSSPKGKTAQMEKIGHTARSRQKKERIIHLFFFAIALASIITLCLIVLFLFMEGLPIFGKVSIQ
ncbi:MAG: hypothetical protein JRJ20_13635, partial [Deltaproteobacteria bacterium]|nr:hypothetical protein [Deltaproteobacteria bacterium]